MSRCSVWHGWTWPGSGCPGVVPVAVPGGPTAQLPMGPAAKFEELLPVLLKEVQHPGDGRLLVGIGVPESLPAFVDIEAADAGLVGEVVHADVLSEDGLPGHLGAVIDQGHGVGNQLEAVIQGAVVLSVEPGLALVGDCKRAARHCRCPRRLRRSPAPRRNGRAHPPRRRGMGGSSSRVDGLLTGNGQVAIRVVGFVVVIARRQVAGLVVGKRAPQRQVMGFSMMHSSRKQSGSPRSYPEAFMVIIYSLNEQRTRRAARERWCCHRGRRGTAPRCGRSGYTVQAGRL